MMVSSISVGVCPFETSRGRRLSRPRAARARGWADVVEVGALGEVLADQAVGVLVGGTLPGAVGVGEVDRDTGDGGEGGVLGHLSALIPGDGGVDGPGRVGDHGLQGVGDGGRVVAGAQAADEHEPAGAFHQGDQGAAPAGADDRVALPVPGDGPLVGLGRAQTDGGAPVSGSLPLGSGFSGQRGAEVCGGCVRCAGPLLHPQLGAQAAGALNVQGLVDLLANRGACSHHRGSRTAGGRRSAWD